MLDACHTRRFYISDSRKMSKADTYLGVRDLQIFKLTIWKDGLKDRYEVKQLVEKIMQWKEE